MSHFLYVSNDGRGRPVEFPDGLTPALDDQDPNLRLIHKILAGIDVAESWRQLHELH